MFCMHCGRQMNDSLRFCPYCGTPNPKYPGAPAGETAAPQKGPEKPKKRGRIVLWIILALIVAALAFAAIRLFPMKLTVDTGDQKLTTREGMFRDLTITLRSNQPIRSAGYALGEVGEETEFQPCALTAGMRERSFTFNKLEVEPGKTQLTLRVRTLFGEETQTLELTSDIGFISTPDPEAMVEIQPGETLITNELILVFKESASEKQIKKLIESYDGEIVGQIYLLGEYHVRFSGYGESYISGLMEDLLEEDLVEDVFYSTAYEADTSLYPNDSGFDGWDTDNPAGNNWGLEVIDAPGAWDHVGELNIVKIGLIDSSLQYDHPDLRIDPTHVNLTPSDDFHSMKQLLDYFKRTADTHQCLSTNCTYCGMRDHGSHCTGIIAATGNNRKGTAGVAWNADIYFTTWWYYSIPSEGQLHAHAYSSGLIYNITRLVSSGCRVISISVGSQYSSIPSDYDASEARRFENAIKRLEDHGYDFLICKSAGNENDDASNYSLNRIMTGGEHAREHVVIVAAAENNTSATDSFMYLEPGEKIYNIASYSNFGSMVDVAAPGSYVYSTVFGDEYANFNGTSMATPMAAGVAGLVYGANPGLTYDTVRNILLSTSKTCCAKRGNIYWMVNANAAVEWALGHRSGSIAPPALPEYGFVTGLVQDAVTSRPLFNATVKITDEDDGDVYLSGTADGQYEFALPSGIYTMEFSAPDYLTETVYHIKLEPGVMTYNVLLNMVEDEEENGHIYGTIINAFDGYGIGGASISIYRGVNNTGGDRVLTTQADSRGSYSAELPPGNYTIYAEAEGYQSGTATVLVIPGEYMYDQNCSLTPLLQNGEMRVVLTWGRYPEDLDSHLVGPAPGGSFHIFYDNMNYWHDGRTYDNLDVDDTTSYGPETTSVYVPLAGTYTFLVHDYSNRESNYSTAMATSGAKVTLYIAGYDEPIVYYVPNQAGTVWTVFSVTDGVVTPINTMGYESNPGRVGR